MGKKDSTALKNDFAEEVLADELLETLDKAEESESALLLEDLLTHVDGHVSAKQNTEKSVAPPQESSEAVAPYDDKTEVLNVHKGDKTLAIESEHIANVTSLSDLRAADSRASAPRDPAIDLKNADYINFAQNRIKDLEAEVSRLRKESEELAMAGDHFKNLAEERLQKNKLLVAKADEVESTAADEKKILNEALSFKDKKVSQLEGQVEVLEQELEARFNRVRVRERELESRLEILKQEQEAITSSKDEMIMKLKKQTLSLSAELEKLKSQSQKSHQSLQEKEEALRRTIKALKLSLTMLESQKES